MYTRFIISSLLLFLFRYLLPTINCIMMFLTLLKIEFLIWFWWLQIFKYYDIVHIDYNIISISYNLILSINGLKVSLVIHSNLISFWLKHQQAPICQNRDVEQLIIPLFFFSCSTFCFPPTHSSTRPWAKPWQIQNSFRYPC